MKPGMFPTYGALWRFVQPWLLGAALLTLAVVVLAGCSNGDNPIRSYKEWRNQTFARDLDIGGGYNHHQRRIWMENRGGRSTMCNNIGGTVNCQ